MSPYKSEAQRKKFHQLEKEGKMKPETVAEFDSASKGLKLPVRMGPKKLGKLKSLKQLQELSRRKK